MKRLNGAIGDRGCYRRIKKMSSPLFDGFQPFYNFTKKHGGVLEGKTPAAEMTRITVDDKTSEKRLFKMLI